jgi:hypothetical protein
LSALSSAPRLRRSSTLPALTQYNTDVACPSGPCRCPSSSQRIRRRSRLPRGLRLWWPGCRICCHRRPHRRRATGRNNPLTRPSSPVFQEAFSHREVRQHRIGAASTGGARQTAANARRPEQGANLPLPHPPAPDES